MSNAGYLRSLRAKAKAAGLCGECRARPAKPGRVSCQVCLDRRYERERAYAAVGLCACGAQTVDDRASCQRCRDANNRRTQRLYHERLTGGLCSRSGCAAHAEPDRAMCRPHLDEATQYQLRRYYARKRAA